MPIPLINSIAAWFLKKRMHQIELFLKYPNEVQNDILLNLIKSAKDTFREAGINLSLPTSPQDKLINLEQ